MSWIVKFETAVGVFEPARPGCEADEAVEAAAKALGIDVELYQLGRDEFAAVLNGNLSQFTVRVFAEALCVRLHQQAVAAYHKDTGAGFLFGPAAELWGPFDLAKFGAFPNDKLG